MRGTNPLNRRGMTLHHIVLLIFTLLVFLAVVYALSNVLCGLELIPGC